MKNSFFHYSALALTGLMLFSACAKEEGGSKITDPTFTLYAEGYGNDAKMAINGKYLTWVTGDKIRINDRVSNVVVQDGVAFIQSAVAYSTPYYCVSPSSIYSSAITSSNITVNLPNSYTYAETDGKQNLPVPMCAYAEGGDALQFKHLTGALTIRIENSFGIDVYVNRIEVSSNNYQICGSKNITISDNPSINAATTSNAADKKITILFNGGTSLNIPCGGVKYVMVPVLPVGNDNRFTVNVTVKSTDGTYSYTFSQTQNTGGNLVRAQIAYAPAKFGGVFSVAGNKKVYFSPGNLQYQASTGTWRFADRQYTVLAGSANGGNKTVAEADRQTQDKWIDLFGWATSGWNGGSWTNYQPWTADATDNQYGPATPGTFYEANQECDWGWHNAISNGGDAVHIWRTLRNTEWNYLLHTRTNGYAKGSVDGANGVIVFCDGYVHPTGLAAIVYPSSPSIASDGASYSDNSFSYADFRKMEIAGAIFLAAGGYHGTGAAIGGGGHYWTANYSSAAGAREFSFDNDRTGDSSDARQRHYGCSVRLVRAAN